MENKIALIDERIELLIHEESKAEESDSEEAREDFEFDLMEENSSLDPSLLTKSMN